MAKVVNTSTNGIISTSLISKIINEVNNINDWLNELGYERPNEGMLISTTFKNRRTRVNDVRGADDFKVFSARYPTTLLKGKTDHGSVTIELPKNTVSTFGTLTATAISGDVPAFVSIKSWGNSQVILDVTTIIKPTANKAITICVIAVADDTNKDAD